MVMQLLMELWKAEPKLQAMEGFPRFAQASSSLIPALDSCFFWVSFLNVGMSKKPTTRFCKLLC